MSRNNNNRPRRNQYSSNEAFKNAMRKYKGKGPATSPNRLSTINNLGLGKILNHLNGRELAQMRTVSKAYRNYIDSRPNLVSKIRNYNNVGIKLIRKHNQIAQHFQNIRKNLSIESRKEGFNRLSKNYKNKYKKLLNVQNKLFNAQSALGRHFLKVPFYGQARNYIFNLAPIRNWNSREIGFYIKNFARRQGLIGTPLQQSINTAQRILKTQPLNEGHKARFLNRIRKLPRNRHPLNERNIAQELLIMFH